MAIKSGRYGKVMYDPAGITPVDLIALNQWTLSQKTDYAEVTCFGDTNKIYVPGLPDASGSFSGFWNSTNVIIFDAITAATPGMLKLVPNTTEATFFWTLLAYLDADINVGLDVPKISGTFKAAGAVTMAP